MILMGVGRRLTAPPTRPGSGRMIVGAYPKTYESGAVGEDDPTWPAGPPSKRSSPRSPHLTGNRRFSRRLGFAAGEIRPTLRVLALAVTAATVAFSGHLLSSRLGEILSQIPHQYSGRPELSTGFVGAALFVASVFSVLGLHEIGHVLAGRFWGGGWEFPVFIPAPPPLGTFGAVITAHRPLVSRDAAYDLGISGPLLGFASSVLVSTLGLASSIYLPPESAPSEVGWSPLSAEGLPQPLIFRMIAGLFSPAGNWRLIMSPVAFAGWAGLVLTFLNLLPAGQLDGGHVVYALLGGGTRARILLLFLIAAAAVYSPTMAILAILMSLGGHPPVVDRDSPLSGWRRALGPPIYAGLLVATAPLPP